MPGRGSSSTSATPEEIAAAQALGNQYGTYDPQSQRWILKNQTPAPQAPATNAVPNPQFAMYGQGGIIGGMQSPSAPPPPVPYQPPAMRDYSGITSTPADRQAGIAQDSKQYHPNGNGQSNGGFGVPPQGSPGGYNPNGNGQLNGGFGAPPQYHPPTATGQQPSGAPRTFGTLAGGVLGGISQGYQPPQHITTDPQTGASLYDPRTGMPLNGQIPPTIGSLGANQYGAATHPYAGGSNTIMRPGGGGSILSSGSQAEAANRAPGQVNGVGMHLPTGSGYQPPAPVSTVPQSTGSPSSGSFMSQQQSDRLRQSGQTPPIIPPSQKTPYKPPSVSYGRSGL